MEKGVTLRKRCAFLTMEDRGGFFIDDELAHDPFRSLGWEVEEVPWRQPASVWRGFDAVLIRSSWDYQTDVPTFLRVLQDIEDSGIPLFNGLDLVHWNLKKTYLRKLELGGVPIVPTSWKDGLASGSLPKVFEEVGSDEIVLKPVVGANADGLVWLTRETPADRLEEAEAYYDHTPLMVQPLAYAVLGEGEYSLFYFGGVISHAILKKTKPGDLRVQEEHGGHPAAVEPEPDLVAAGSLAIEALPEVPLYARVDLVRSNDQVGFWLMELELIEPALYLRMDADAPHRFAEAFHRRIMAEASNSGGA